MTSGAPRPHQLIPSSHSRLSKAQELPPEVLDLVFSCLLNDKQALSACSLVCRYWLSNTRRYLFHDITIRPQGKLRDAELLRFLSDSPDRKWIKNIVIRGGGPVPLTMPFFAACLGKFSTKLHSLTLVDVEFYCREPLHEVVKTAQPTVQVETLGLRQGDVTTVGLIQILSIFSDVGMLIIYGGSSWTRMPVHPTELGSHYDEDSRKLIEQRTVRALRAGRGCSLTYLRHMHMVLRRYCSSASFTTLHLPCPPKGTLSDACTWLAEENKRLTGLTLDFSWDSRNNRTSNGHSEDAETGFNLRELGLTSLTSLTVDICISLLHFGGRPLRADMWNRLTTIIKTSPPGLCQLKVGFVTAGALTWVLDKEEIDWEAFGSALAELRDLKLLSFAKRSRDFDIDEITVIRRHLEGLKLPPFLSIQFCSEESFVAPT